MTLSIAAAVVHHRRYPEVLDTLHSLVEAGVPVQSVLVVDNSEDQGIEDAMRSSTEGWQVHSMPNLGYGAAANEAMRLAPDSDVLLVLTHEVLISGPSVAALLAALADDPNIAAAGPRLIVTDESQVWSRGGVLSHRLLLPRHVIDPPKDARSAADVDWLDGACVAYRTEVLRTNPFREDFFLYFEETELHARLRAGGFRIVAVTGAHAYQSSGGMPAYWGCRNIVLFQQAHGTRLSRVIGPAYFTLRMMGINMLARNWHAVLSAPRGLRAGYAAARAVSR
jgi:N-acetylglucosaminyl-diphospho-decaprenol L-rhamnosyltransferase